MPFFVGFKIKKDFPEGIYDNTNFKIVSFEYEKWFDSINAPPSKSPYPANSNVCSYSWAVSEQTENLIL